MKMWVFVNTQLISCSSEVVITLFPTAPKCTTRTTPSPITSPSSDVTPTAICMKCFLAAASTRLQNESLRGGKAREEAQWKQEEEEGVTLVFHIRGAERGKKRPESEGKVSDTKSREGVNQKKRKQKNCFSCVGKWSYPPLESTSLRWRASRRSAAERFVTRTLKDISTYMRMEMRMISLFSFF